MYMIFRGEELRVVPEKLTDTDRLHQILKALDSGPLKVRFDLFPAEEGERVVTLALVDVPDTSDAPEPA